MNNKYFDYKELCLSEIAEEIKEVIDNNNKEGVDEYEEPIGKHFSEEVIEHLKTTVDLLGLVQELVEQVDFLFSEEINEEEFLNALLGESND